MQSFDKCIRFLHYWSVDQLAFLGNVCAFHRYSPFIQWAPRRRFAINGHPIWFRNSVIKDCNKSYIVYPMKSFHQWLHFHHHDGSARDFSNFIINALELLHFCSKPSISTNFLTLHVIYSRASLSRRIIIFDHCHSYYGLLCYLCNHLI